MTAFGSGPARPRRALVALLCVIALHLALYLALRGPAGWASRDAARPAARTGLRLLPWPQPKMPAARAQAESADRPATVPGRRAPAPITRAAPSANGPSQPVAESAQADASAVPERPASQPPRPLDLTLRPGLATRPGARNPAIDDPRANTARLTPEQRMAAALDTQVIEEDLGDGRRRIRQGANCVIVKPSRIGQLMPFNDAATRAPSLVGACP